MKKILLLSLIGLAHTTHAQLFKRYMESRHTIGLFTGGNNYIVDAGRRTFIYPNDLAAGVVYKYYPDYRLALRLNVTAARLTARDKDCKNAVPLRNDEVQARGNTILEGALVLEFNFFTFDPFEVGAHTPYLYLGLGTTSYRLNFITPPPGEVQTGQRWSQTLALPLSLGYKYKLTDRLILGAETGIRYTFTDNLDNNYLIPEDESDARLKNPIVALYLNQHRYGNARDHDWYVFTGFTLTYNFGHRPCYCDRNLKQRKKKFLIY